MIDWVSSRLPLGAVQLTDLLEYLKASGWQSADLMNPRWYVFQGNLNTDAQGLEIVLPRVPLAPDIAIYFENTVNLLAALGNESPELTLQRIRTYDRDTLQIRNLDTDEDNTIPLWLATQQIVQARQLIGFAAYLEYRPKPNYPNGRLSTKAQRVADNFRFGHTFAGSFGFSIENRVRAPRTVAMYTQQSLLGDDSRSEIIMAPTERKAMERIIRGLMAAESAPRDQDPQRLVDQYTSGFNANMCRALLRIVPDKTESVIFSINWSLKVQPPADIQDPGPIRLSTTSYDYLAGAARQLKSFKPEPTTIRGPVESLTSRGNPRSLGSSDRWVVVKWTYRPDGRPVQVLMRLNIEDYEKAHKAHLDYQTVEVSGELRQTGSPWELLNPTGFHLTT